MHECIFVLLLYHACHLSRFETSFLLALRTHVRAHASRLTVTCFACTCIRRRMCMHLARILRVLSGLVRSTGRPLGPDRLILSGFFGYHVVVVHVCVAISLSTTYDPVRPVDPRPRGLVREYSSQ